MKNLVTFLVKTLVLFLAFWLLSAVFTRTEASLPNWAVWLILAAVASLFDYIVDALIKPGSKIAEYTRYTPKNLA